jgi:hypothetical protein
LARDAASLLSEASDVAGVQSLETIMPIITAIELLLDYGDVGPALDLYDPTTIIWAAIHDFDDRIKTKDVGIFESVGVYVDCAYAVMT